MHIYKIQLFTVQCIHTFIQIQLLNVNNVPNPHKIAFGYNILLKLMITMQYYIPNSLRIANNNFD